MIALLLGSLAPILATGGAVLACVAVHAALVGWQAGRRAARHDKALTGFLVPPRCDGCGLHVSRDPCPRCGVWWPDQPGSGL